MGKARAGLTITDGKREGGKLEFWTTDREAASRVSGAVSKALNQDCHAGFSMNQTGRRTTVTFWSEEDEVFNEVMRIASEEQNRVLSAK